MKKTIVIIGILIIWLSLIIAFPLSFSQREEKVPSEKIVLLDSKKDFTEEELEMMNKFMKDGYSIADAIRLSNPEKYKELLENSPHVIEILNDSFLEKHRLKEDE